MMEYRRCITPISIPIPFDSTCASTLWGAIQRSFMPSDAQVDPAWGSKMFDVTELDFGTVAAGIRDIYSGHLKNPFKEDIQITDLQPWHGPGCFLWRDAAADGSPITIPSGQQRKITLLVDTSAIVAITSRRQPFRYSTPFTPCRLQWNCQSMFAFAKISNSDREERIFSELSNRELVRNEGLISTIPDRTIGDWQSLHRRTLT